MRSKKRRTYAFTAVLITAMMAGCGMRIPMKEEPIRKREPVITVSEAVPEPEVQSVTRKVVVQATAIEGDTITGVTLTAAEKVVTFLLKDTTVITVEFQQGSGEGTAEDIAIGAILEAELDETGQAVSVMVKNLNEGGSAIGSANGSVTDTEETAGGTFVITIDVDTTESEKTYTSKGDNENALRIDGAEVTLEEVKIEKLSGESSDMENGDLYGWNAGLLVLNGAQVTIRNADVNTSVVNGNSIFSYGEDTIVSISNSVIRTTGDHSGGIRITGGGTAEAYNLDVETQGTSSAAIRSGRGGGTVTVDSGSFVTNGTGSPAIYAASDITVTDAVLTANASEGVIVEGKSSVTLKNCTLNGNMKNTEDSDPDENIHGIMLYQSMSGDADIGKAYFSAEGGSITAQRGDMFYVTNTDSEIVLKDVTFMAAGGIFLRVEGNTSSHGWGTAGANGGNVVLTTEKQKMEGNILVDEISSLDFTMKKGTVFTGAVNPSGASGAVHITMEAGAVWKLTADTYVDSISGDRNNIDLNGYQLFVSEEEE